MATRAMPRAMTGDGRAYQVSAWLLGFFLQFNLVPTAWHIPITRISQLAMIPCILFLVHSLSKRRNPLWPLFYCTLMLVFVILHLAFTGASLSFGNSNDDLAITLSYGLYLIGGVGLYIIVAQRSGTGWFCWGLLSGALASLGVFFLESIGQTGLAVTLGLVQPHQVVQSIGDSEFSRRLTGMWGHANEVGHVLAMTAPAAGYLYLSQRKKLPFAIVAIVMLVAFFYTANRGGMIAAVLSSMIVLFVRPETPKAKRLSILLAIAGLAIVVIALYVLPPPAFLYARFFGDSNLDHNASGRLTTTLAGIDLAVHHPFGMALSDWRLALRDRTGFLTPHNGFISLTNGLGIPFFLMYLAAVFVVVVAGLRRNRKMSLDIYLMLAAFQASVSFMFEELSYCDTFMLLSGLILARVYSSAVDLTKPRRSGGRVRHRSDAPAVPRPAEQQA